MDESVEDRTRRVVSDVFGLPLEMVTQNTSYEAVEQWDSLNILNLLMAIEEEFGISIGPEEVAELVSVSRIIKLVKSKQ